MIRTLTHRQDRSRRAEWDSPSQLYIPVPKNHSGPTAWHGKPRGRGCGAAASPLVSLVRLPGRTLGEVAVAAVLLTLPGEHSPLPSEP